MVSDIFQVIAYCPTTHVGAPKVISWQHPYFNAEAEEKQEPVWEKTSAMSSVDQFSSGSNTANDKRGLEA